jgi:hypothetical protein
MRREVRFLSTVIKAPNARRMDAISVYEIAKVANPYTFNCFLEIICPILISIRGFVWKFHNKVVHHNYN